MRRSLRGQEAEGIQGVGTRVVQRLDQQQNRRLSREPQQHSSERLQHAAVVGLREIVLVVNWSEDLDDVRDEVGEGRCPISQEIAHLGGRPRHQHRTDHINEWLQEQ